MACLLAREHTTDMTQRKPPGVSWESWFDEQIRRAREDGAFDNLPGAGKPLPDLEGGSGPRAAPHGRVRDEEDLGAAKRSRRQAQVLGLNAEIARANARTAEGPPTRLGLLDPDAIVAQWRARSTAS